MSENEMSYQEISPTFWRLTKLCWSQYWRIFLLFIPLFIGYILLILILAYVFMGVETENFKSTTENFENFMDFFSTNSIILEFIKIHIPLYFLQVLLFTLILGKNYSDFTFTFVPKMDRKTPGYWPMLFYISWAYYWRMMLIQGLLQFTGFMFPQLLEEMSIFIGFSMFLQVLTGILLLRFVVNQPYGKVRLSLIKREKRS